MSVQHPDFVIGIADDEPEIREMIRASVEVEFQRRFPGMTIPQSHLIGRLRCSITSSKTLRMRSTCCC